MDSKGLLRAYLIEKYQIKESDDPCERALEFLQTGEANLLLSQSRVHLDMRLSDIVRLAADLPDMIKEVQVCAGNRRKGQ